MELSTSSDLNPEQGECNYGQTLECRGNQEPQDPRCKAFGTGDCRRIDRTVGGVVFKAYQLGLTLKARSRVTDPDWVDLIGERTTVALLC